ncbi:MULTISPECIES: hypothetical protein [Sinorhizobium]|uniref:Uncharacterized protein n=1 Tax=Sinorhizobium americanum TaxID=194963 RepID=A0A2S3YNI4_9HYPH|nr:MULTISPECIES: hypothetical protein [Sinorhizobium]PDT33380.1 hypothetical protein CO656_28625 [Sinorhizobium sp. FG01]PDT47990.1 hypothetical protein CO664_29460 [Sinorhizobium sp. NG07B]POH29883.1 hypothetical protein ATY30_14070 [Sinorhizobium americanum]POH30586.1 hypothetical protein ATY31_14555 [Sinorhizobium americanum]
MCSFSLSRRLTSRTGAAAVELAVAATLCFLYLSGARPVAARRLQHPRRAQSLAGIRGLLTGLVIKFSAFIAEIVQAGIPSVGTGQWEAARALGLHDG